MRRFTFAAVAMAVLLGGFGLVQMNRAEEAAKKDIVDVAVEAGSFKTLAKALQAAGLVETLKGKGPFTVFAPTDEAFAKLPEGTLESLLKDKAKLTAVLTYHVVAGEYPAEKVVASKSLKTVQGSPIKITVGDAGVKVNQAKVLKTDIRASSGIIHVIDAVILPPEKSEGEGSSSCNAGGTKG
jgi:uncharacterized surface protein with fasciclin (FAS1) repeats